MAVLMKSPYYDQDTIFTHITRFRHMRTINRIGAFSILTIIVGVCMSACIAQGEPAAESPDEASIAQGEPAAESPNEASPLAVSCIDGTCESLMLCNATGGRVVGPCGIPVNTVCCEFKVQ
jgi:hypothetical protein